MNNNNTKSEVLFLDCEWSKTGKLLTVQYCDEHGRFDYLFYRMPFFKEKVEELLRDKHVIGYNLVSDFTILYKNGIKVFDLIKDWDDLYLLAILYFYKEFSDSRNKKLPLDKVLELCGIPYELDKREDRKFFIDDKWALFKSLPENIVEYIKQDVVHLKKVYEYIMQRISKRQLAHYLKIEKPMVKVVVLMNLQGFGFDSKKALQRFSEYNNQLKILERQMRDMDPALEKINFRSPEQVKRYFQTENANKETLTKLASEGNEVAQLLLKYKSLEKEKEMLSSFMKSRKSNVVYGHFSVTYAPSGRMSCENVNLQQVPRGLRDLFISKYENGYLVCIDFPQIELRLAGLLYSPEMRELFKKKLDLHTETAKVLFSKQDISKEERKIAKAANFGLLYGMSHNTFREYVFMNTGIRLSELEAKAIKENWLNAYESIKIWHKHTQEELKKNGYYESETILFRRYYSDELNSALNYRIQGSGADLLKAVAVRAFKEYGIVPCALVHDEIVVDVPDYETALEVARTLTRLIEDTWQKLTDVAINSHRIKTEYVPLGIEEEVDKAVIKNWGEKE